MLRALTQTKPGARHHITLRRAPQTTKQPDAATIRKHLPKF